MKKLMNQSTQRGFSIIEVMIGVFIFAVGMLALASLQGALTRSMADSKLRTEASNIAEQLIESQRGFSRIFIDPDGIVFAFNDIVDGTTTTTVNGVTYTVAQDVSDYYYDLATDIFTGTATLGALASDYKTVAVTVSWDGDRQFRIQEGVETTGSLGSGSVTVTGVISASATAGSGRVSEESEDQLLMLAISYTPGQNPDIISLSLDEGKFKESLLPMPDVKGVGALIETRFDVITYSQDNSGALFLRREEFAAVQCDCTLQAPKETDLGRRPTIWAGDEYAEGHFVRKAFGIAAKRKQSDLCGTCCQDHHDGGSSAEDHPDSAVNTYDPFKASTEYHSSGPFAGDHKHYGEDGVTLAGNRKSYVEACRMVRRDGFFKVAQDFRREDLNVFPADYLDDSAEIAVYSSYVTGAATAYEAAAYLDYESNPPCIGGPIPCVAEANFQGDYPTAINLGNAELPSWTQLRDTAEPTQQLRSRAIYIDYLSDDLRTVIDCINSGGDELGCKTGDVELDRTASTNVLELIPFFDVQLTFLNRWNETPINTPVNTTNETLALDNAHSRGVASADALDSSTVAAKGHRGNLGFTDSQAIDPVYASKVTQATINVQSLDAGAGGAGPTDPPPSGDPVVSGSLLELLAGNGPIITVSGLLGALCDQTSVSFECRAPSAASNPRLQVSGYGKANRIDRDGFVVFTPRYACSATLVKISEDPNDVGANAVFNLSSADPDITHTITIQGKPCPISVV